MNHRAILDTSFLLALTNHRYRNHGRVLEVARAFTGTLVLPSSVLPEVCYLIASRLGHLTMRRFLHQVVTRNDLLRSSLTSVDLERVIEILELSLRLCGRHHRGHSRTPKYYTSVYFRPSRL